MGTNAYEFWFQATIFDTQIKAGRQRTCGELVRTYHLIIEEQVHIFHINVNNISEKRTWSNCWVHWKCLLHGTMRRNIWSAWGQELAVRFCAVVFPKRELYGLKTAYNSFCNLFGVLLRDIGFTPSRAEQYLWMRK